MVVCLSNRLLRDIRTDNFSKFATEISNVTAAGWQKKMGILRGHITSLM
jgi:hypothetical protein